MKKLVARACRMPDGGLELEIEAGTRSLERTWFRQSAYEFRRH